MRRLKMRRVGTTTLVSNYSNTLQELLILSTSSPVRRSRTRISDRLETGDDPVYEPVGSRRRCRAKTISIGLQNCASPRNIHRSRRRLEVDVREEREIVDDVAKVKRKRHSGKSRKEKLTSLPSSSTVPCAKENERDESNLEGIGELITDLIMWRDIAKSSFWFGLGMPLLPVFLFHSKIELQHHLGRISTGSSVLGSQIWGCFNSMNSICVLKENECVGPVFTFTITVSGPP